MNLDSPTMKWIKLIRFVNKHRKKGCGSFKAHTTGDEFIIIPIGKQISDEDYDQLRIKQKFWTP